MISQHNSQANFSLIIDSSFVSFQIIFFYHTWSTTSKCSNGCVTTVQYADFWFAIISSTSHTYFGDAPAHVRTNEVSMCAASLMDSMLHLEQMMFHKKSAQQQWYDPCFEYVFKNNHAYNGSIRKQSKISIQIQWLKQPTYTPKTLSKNNNDHLRTCSKNNHTKYLWAYSKNVHN